MAYGKVSETFWHDDKIRALSEPARHFMLYLMSCPHGNRLGFFVLDPMYAAADVGWPANRVRDALEELAEARRVSWDETNRIVFVRNFLRHNTLLNGSVVKGALNDLAAVPDTPLLDELRVVVQAGIDGEDGKSRTHYQELMDAIMHRIMRLNMPDNMPDIMPESPGSRVLPEDSHSGSHNDPHYAGQTIQGTGVSKPTPGSSLESNDRERAAPEGQSPDGLAQMLDEHPEAGDVLDGLKHPGGPEATAATLRTRFLYADDSEAMPDKAVNGLDFDTRRRAVAAAFIEYRDQGNTEWQSRHFAGFVRRVLQERAPANGKAKRDFWGSSP